MVNKPVAWCWAGKAELRKIRQECANYASALAVYHALSEIASDKESDEFQTTQEWLAQLSGFKARTIRRRLKDLQEIGVVQIQTPKLKAPSTYRLRRSAMVSQRKDIVSERPDKERASPCPTSEEQNKKKEDLPTAKGKGGLKARWERLMADE
jgi:predicted DsbA family dithiol-disulfide isomerase